MTTSLHTTAPGKVLLFGEYAVLDGGQALVAAVARRAHCTVEPADGVEVVGTGIGAMRWPLDGPDVLPFARALFGLAEPPPGRYTLESDAFSERGGRMKLGLGSSAATTVALAAAIRQSTDPATLFGLAQAAHRAAQGTGSGADVAAVAFGGVLAYRWHADGPLIAGDGAATVRPITGGRDRLAMAWSGRPASTTALVARVRAFADADPLRYRYWMDQLAEAAEEACLVWASGGDLTDPAGTSLDLLAALGEAAGVDLVLPTHWRLDALAEPHGCRVKPTGAGGGDLAWIAGPDAEAEAQAAAALAAAGERIIWLPVDPVGATLAKGAGDATKTRATP
ncbi:MAG: hypothetical protein H6706_28620 [Myxococcales bacterium]|nr:hypothetical protein [Myxococcales bacterium]